MISNSNGERYVGLSEASRLVGVSTVTVHNYLTQGLVLYRKNIKGIRSINVPSLCEAFGIDPPEEPEELAEKKLGIYIRVSSQSQKSEGSLDGQEARMIDWACSTFDVTEDDLLIFSDCASAFGVRRGLQKMIEAMLDGKLSVVACEFADRLSRMSSEMRLIEHLAKRQKVKLIFKDETILDSEAGMFVKELVDFVTVIAARSNGRKSSERSKIHMCSESLQRAHELVTRSALSMAGITEVLKQEGFRDANGKPYKPHVVTKRLEEFRKARMRQSLIKGEIIKEEDLLDQFIAEELIQGDGCSVLAKDLFLLWCEFCSKRDGEPGTKWSFAERLKSKGFAHKKSTLYKHKGNQIWIGLGKSS